jgi:hypothetical protein
MSDEEKLTVNRAPRLGHEARQTGGPAEENGMTPMSHGANLVRQIEAATGTRITPLPNEVAPDGVTNRVSVERQTLELVRVFCQIEDASVRQHVLEMVRAAAEQG